LFFFLQMVISSEIEEDPIIEMLKHIDFPLSSKLFNKAVQEKSELSVLLSSFIHLDLISLYLLPQIFKENIKIDSNSKTVKKLIINNSVFFFIFIQIFNKRYYLGLPQNTQYC